MSQAEREQTAKNVQDMLEAILRHLQGSDVPFEVSYRLGPDTIAFSIKTERLGVVLGKQGKTIDCIRHLVDAVGSKHGHRVVIETLF